MSQKSTVTVESFYTREAANQGIKVPLTLPDGSPTEHYLLVLGIDSDIGQRARSTFQRTGIDLLMEFKKTPPSESEEEAYYVKEAQHQKQYLASFIKDWSFEEECSTQNKILLLTEAPAIKETLDKTILDRHLFLGSRSKVC